MLDISIIQTQLVDTQVKTLTSAQLSLIDKAGSFVPLNLTAAQRNVLSQDMQALLHSKHII